MELSMRRIVLFVLFDLAVWTLARGEDFNQWRGPQRNGLTTGGPALDVQWGKAGPAKLWESEAIPGSVADSSGCVSVAGGRVYVYVQWKYKVDLATRALSDSDLRRLGWTNVSVPDGILAAVEQARVGPELGKLSGRPRLAWITKWAEDHVTTNADKMPIFGYAVDRLDRGTAALPFDLLAKLETIRNKPFPDKAALDKWFADNRVSDEHKAAVLKAVSTSAPKSWDTLICLNAADGKTVFKKQFEGGIPNPTYWYGASSTPTVVDGRCYFCGSKNDIYCVDAVTGEEIWQINPRSRRGGINHSSPLVVDGKVIVAAGELIALECSKGTELWRQPKVIGRESSPAVWSSGGRAFVLCNSANQVYSVDVRDGSIVWSVPGAGSNTPTVVGDLMVTAIVIGAPAGDNTKYGLLAYRLSAEKAEKLWATDKYSCGYEGPVIHDGYVYSFGRGNACIDLATGKVAWEDDKPLHTGVRQPVLADGKIFLATGAGILAVQATPEKFDLLGSVRLPAGYYTAPAVADGRLYLRQTNSVACYDLTRVATPTVTTSPATRPDPR
jgi:outer membrane protein assembly factor BamB